MQPPWKWNALTLDHHTRSKWTDGVLSAVMLCLTWLTVALIVRPIQVLFGPPGLLVYVLFLMAVSMFSLQQSLAVQRGDASRAWWGIVGGFLAWLVISISAHLGVPMLSGPSGLILPMMVSMIVMLLWRSVLPVGPRFFSLTLLLSWGGFLVMSAQAWLANFSPVFHLTYRATGYLAILAGVLILGWMLFLSRRRIQRVSAALALWFLFSTAFSVFLGGLF